MNVVDDTGETQYRTRQIPPLLSLECLTTPAHVLQILNEKLFTVTPIEVLYLVQADCQFCYVDGDFIQAIATEVNEEALKNNMQSRIMSPETSKKRLLLKALVAEPESGYPFKEYIFEYACDQYFYALDNRKLLILI